METIITHPLLGPFVLKLEVGRGAFATVYLALHKTFHYPVAIKVFDILDEEDEMEDITHEIKLLRNNVHPLIVDIYDSFEFEGHQCLLMEYVEGDSLLDYANENGPFTEDELRDIFVQIIIAVYSLHKLNIIHRDIKCENIIVDTFRNVKLIDFGFAQQVNPQNPALTTACGSPAYVAPEIVKNQPYDFQVDVWSLGVILYAISVGHLPFDHPNVVQIITMVVMMEPQYPNAISPLLSDLLQKMLTKDPTQRITIQGILQHPWLTTDESGKRYDINIDVLNKFSSVPQSDQDIDETVYNILKTSKTKEQVKTELILRERTMEAMTYKIINRKRKINRMGSLGSQLFREKTNKVHRVQTLNNEMKSFLPNNSPHKATTIIGKNIIFKPHSNNCPSELTRANSVLDQPQISSKILVRKNTMPKGF